jgi:serine/threonine protein kinase
MLDLIKQILKIDPLERLTCEKALLHPFFNSINAENKIN